MYKRQISSYLNTSALEKYLAIIAENSSKGLYLDDGTLVGHLLPAIDSGRGKTQKPVSYTHLDVYKRQSYDRGHG